MGIGWADDAQDRRVRIPYEVSPVVQGAGINTGTLVMKGAALKQDRFERLTGDLAEVLTSIRADPTALSAAGLRQVASLHDGLGAILKAAEAEAASARRLMAEQAYRASRRHLQTS